MINLHRSLLYLFCCFSTALFSQSEITVNTSIQQVGKRLDQPGTIDAKVYIFPSIISSLHIDTLNESAGIELREVNAMETRLKNRGTYLQYSLKEQKIQWMQEMNFATQRIENFGGVTLQSKGSKNFCLDKNTGERTWKIKNNLLFADIANQIGMGYQINAMNFDDKNYLEGYDLNSGHFLWYRYIYSGYGWNEARYLNDSTLLISAAGVHTLNIFNGQGWSYEAETAGKYKSGAQLGLAALGVAAGLLTGFYAIPTGGDMVTDICSNVVHDTLTNNYYFADSEQLVKLSSTGEVLWKAELPKGQASSSHLELIDDQVLLVNYGYGHMATYPVNYGTPFISSYDIESGTPKFLKILTKERKEFMMASTRRGDTLFCAFSDRILAYSIKNQELLVEQKFDPEIYSNIIGFVGEQVYTFENDSLLPLVTSHPDLLMVMTHNGILALDNDFTSKHKYEYAALYALFAKYKNYSLVGNDVESYVLNPVGKSIARLDISKRSKILKDKLYHVKQNSVYEVYLTGILK